MPAPGPPSLLGMCSRFATFGVIEMGRIRGAGLHVEAGGFRAYISPASHKRKAAELATLAEAPTKSRAGNQHSARNAAATAHPADVAEVRH